MNKRQNILIGGVLLLWSAVLITAFSACSPFYPLNPWDDANCFLILGRSLLEGRMPYREVFDQKGPGVFLVQAACDAVGVRAFFGFYLLEIVSLWAYLYFAWKMMLLFTRPNAKGQQELALVLTGLLGLALTTSDFFYYGNTVEELGLPWITFMLYELLCYARNRVVPSRLAATGLGIGFGVLFWSKFTVLSPFVGAFIAILILCIREHKMAVFWKTVGWAICGFAGVSMLVVGIFVGIGGLTDMLDGYFGYNLFRYHGVGAEDSDDSMGIYPIRLVALAALISIPLLHRKVNKDVRLLVTLSFATSLVLFALTTVYIYYFIICFAFFPLLYYYVRRLSGTWKTWTVAGILAIGMVATDFSLAQRIRGTFPQAILSIVDQLSDEDCDGGVLTYRSRETGYYIYSGQLPPNRFFFLLSMVHQDLKDDQDECLRSRKCRYVIVKDQVLEDEAYLPIAENGYELIAERKELFRTLKLLNPKIYLWNLGWTQPVMKKLLKEEPQPETAIFRLYERR